VILRYVELVAATHSKGLLLIAAMFQVANFMVGPLALDDGLGLAGL
jgi:hypothetical protein